MERFKASTSSSFRLSRSFNSSNLHDFFKKKLKRNYSTYNRLQIQLKYKGFIIFPSLNMQECEKIKAHRLIICVPCFKKKYKDNIIEINNKTNSC
jgi:hypothetical protein